MSYVLFHGEFKLIYIKDSKNVDLEVFMYKFEDKNRLTTLLKSSKCTVTISSKFINIHNGTSSHI